jgi:hypothetical protein
MRLLRNFKKLAQTPLMTRGIRDTGLYLDPNSGYSAAAFNLGCSDGSPT